MNNKRIIMKIKYYVLDKSHTSRKTTRLISTTFDTRMTPPRAAISSIEFQIGVGGSVSRAWHERGTNASLKFPGKTIIRNIYSLEHKIQNKRYINSYADKQT